jgi:hypothetical protein
MVRLALVAAAAGLLAVPAFAASSEPATPAPEVEADEDRVICKTTPQLGTRLRKNKSCRTAKEWADLRQQTRNKTEEMQRVGIKRE